jgi:hypothetical protein
MSPAQQGFYWRLWSEVCEANRWAMVKGRFVHDPARLGKFGPEIVALAKSLADCGAIKLDNLRHACHIFALGRDCSMKKLITKEFNKIKALFQILTDDQNTQAWMEWENAEIAECRSLVIAIKRMAPPEYIQEIARCKWNVKSWQFVDITSLRWLARELAHRKPTWPAGGTGLPAEALAEAGHSPGGMFAALEPHGADNPF